MKQGLVIAATSALLVIACSSDKGAGTDTSNGTGGAAVARGGGVGTGGVLGTGGSAPGGTGGMLPASGGVNGNGGAFAGTGGAIVGTGGAIVGTGGVQYGTGGALATGGRPSGGTAPATGGSPASGGIGPTAGGSPGTGGTSPATGGSPRTGGTGPIAGGSPGTGGAGTGGTTPVDPNASAAIAACMDKLPYGGKNLTAAQRAPIVTAIINTCAEFAPPGAEWQMYCQMFLVAAINAESSFDPLAGSVGAGGDPSVGLLQIRFSSVVRDFADYGPIDALGRIGCNFGTVTSSDSYATKSAMMLDVNCNVAIGAWYYFIFGSGNGGTSTVWVYQYCAGGAVAGNLHIGMACFLMGADAAHSSLSGADYYYNEIKSWFDPCVSYSGTHPFERSIQPDIAKYCG
jgi:hypothetical protein